MATVAPSRSQVINDRLDERLGVLGTRRVDPTRAATSAGVAVQRELADDQHLAAGVGDRSVHHAVVVVDHPQAPDLVGQLAGVRLGVVVGHADQHAQAGTDRADDLPFGLTARDASPTPATLVAPNHASPESAVQNGSVIELRAGSAACTRQRRRTEAAWPRLTVGSTDLLIRQDPRCPRQGGAAIPMVPWAGRIRNGRFTLRRRRLPAADQLRARTPSTDRVRTAVGSARSRCDAVACCGARSAWVFGGEAEQLIELDDDSLSCTLTARAGDNPMPASIGWHPWFVKPERVDLRFERMYLRDDDYITDGRTVVAATTTSVGRLLRRSIGYATAVDRRYGGLDLRATATTGSSTTCQLTPPVSSRRPPLPMPSTWLTTSVAQHVWNQATSCAEP